MKISTRDNRLIFLDPIVIPKVSLLSAEQLNILRNFYSAVDRLLSANKPFKLLVLKVVQDFLKSDIDPSVFSPAVTAEPIVFEFLDFGDSYFGYCFEWNRFGFFQISKRWVLF